MFSEKAEKPASLEGICVYMCIHSNNIPKRTNERMLQTGVANCFKINGIHTLEYTVNYQDIVFNS